MPSRSVQNTPEPSFKTVDDTSHHLEASGTIGNPSISDSGVNTQTLDLDPPVEPVRRSGRARQAPQRYGDWLLNGQSFDPEKIVHWV